MLSLVSVLTLSLGTSGSSAPQVKQFNSIDQSDQVRSRPRQPPQYSHQGRQKVTSDSEVNLGVASLQRATSDLLGGGEQVSHRQSD